MRKGVEKLGSQSKVNEERVEKNKNEWEKPTAEKAVALTADRGPWLTGGSAL